MHKWGSLSSALLEMGSKDGLQPAQYSSQDRLLCQVACLSQIVGAHRVAFITANHDSADAAHYSGTSWERVCTSVLIENHVTAISG